MSTTEKEYDYKGCHSTADIVLKSYPKNMIEIFRSCIKYSNLNIVSEHIHQFTDDAATGVYILSESHASIHEYNENLYVTCDIYTCGEEGDPEAALSYFIKTLDELVGVEKSNIKFFKRGDFEKFKPDITSYEFINTEKDTYQRNQDKLDDICKSLTAEQSKKLQEVLDFTAYSDYS
jgi:S-adenosylmethionine decarboxylase proenzyme